MRDPALDPFAVNLEMWWTDLPPLERVRAANDAGFSRAEIWFWRRWDIEALATACSRHGIELTQLGGWDFEPRMHDPAHRGALRDGVGRAIDVARRLGVGLINLNGPYLDPNERAGDVRHGVVEALRSVIDLAESAGVRLMVEPMNTRVDHPDYSLPTSDDVLAVCDVVDSPALGINWDLYHLQISEGDLSGHLAAGMRHVAYLQIADHPGRHEPGTGEIDYEYLLPRVRPLGYHGPIGLECFPRDEPGTAISRLRRITSITGATTETA